MCRWVATTASVLLLAGAILSAQTVKTADQKTPAFEVASVKQNKSGSIQSNIGLQPGGRFAAVNVALVGLIRIAYGTTGPLGPSSFPDVPSWFYTEHYDILAKADDNVTQDQLLPLLRSLLADRFKLSLHMEARTTRVYALVVARRDNQFGPGLRRSHGECAGPSERIADGCPILNAPGVLRARGIPVETLTRMLSGSLEDHRRVDDETGLTGTFDLDLRWTPDRAPQLPLDAPPEIAQAVATLDPNGASLFTAIQEQLGLKLESKNEQVDVIVIDHVEKPTPD
jgi:bla regulator protein blaR1